MTARSASQGSSSAVRCTTRVSRLRCRSCKADSTCLRRLISDSTATTPATSPLDPRTDWAVLSSSGVGVRPILTKAGAQFVTPLSLSALAEDRVYSELFSLTDEAARTGRTVPVSD
mgnify:CR=1 FL=1